MTRPGVLDGGAVRGFRSDLDGLYDGTNLTAQERAIKLKRRSGRGGAKTASRELRVCDCSRFGALCWLGTPAKHIEIYLFTPRLSPLTWRTRRPTITPSSSWLCSQYRLSGPGLPASGSHLDAHSLGPFPESSVHPRPQLGHEDPPLKHGNLKKGI